MPSSNIDTTPPDRRELLAEYLDLRGADNPMKIPEVAKASGESRSGENHYSYGQPNKMAEVVGARWKNTPKNKDGKYIIPHLQGERVFSPVVGKDHYNHGKAERMRQVVKARWANTPKDENGKYIIPHLKGNSHAKKYD